LVRLPSTKALNFAAAFKENKHVFAALRSVANGTSRHFAAAQQFGRFRSEADIEPLTEPDF
jgi:hypothetical protein